MFIAWISSHIEIIGNEQSDNTDGGKKTVDTCMQQQEIEGNQAKYGPMYIFYTFSLTRTSCIDQTLNWIHSSYAFIRKEALIDCDVYNKVLTVNHIF